MLREMAVGHNEKNRAMAERELAAIPDPPEPVQYLWEWFQTLDSARRYGMSGAEPLTFSDLDAFARLLDVDPTPAEVRALLFLDATIRAPGKAPASFTDREV